MSNRLVEEGGELSSHGQQRRAALRQSKAFALLAIAVIALQVFVTLSHFPWQDEWQALLIARDTPSFRSLMHALRYEGHPLLWYLWLKLIADFVPFHLVLPVAALGIAVVSSVLILFVSQFQPVERIFLALSEFVLIEFNAVSRGTTLGTMLCFMTAALWRTPWVWIPIVLLPQCDFFFGVISLALLVLLWRGAMWSWLGAFMWVLSGLAAAITVLPASDMVPAVTHGGLLPEIYDWTRRMGVLLWPLQFSGFQPMWSYFAFPLIAPWGWIVFIWLGLHCLRDWPLAQRLWAFFVASQFVFSLTIYPLAPRHLALSVLLLILLIWIGRLQGLAGHSRAFGVWIGGAAVAGLASAAFSHERGFDSANIAATRLQVSGLLKDRTVSFPISGQQGIIATTGTRLEHPQRDCLQSFTRWDSQNLFFSAREVERYLRNVVDRKGRVNILTYYDLGFLPPSFARLRYQSPAGFDGYTYRLYTIGIAQAPQSPPATLCEDMKL